MRKIINILVISLISIIVLPYNVNAANVISLDANVENNKITVSGDVEDEVLAIAVLVYSGDELVDMETCGSDTTYSCELNKEFESGTYTVKVADYNGGEYLTKNITIKTTENNPKTGDGIIKNLILGSISLICLIGCGLYIKKRRES